MPYALILVGVLMVVTGAQNTYAQFAGQLKTDAAGFTKYALAFGIVGAAGYVEDLRGLSRMFMALILLSLILGNKGFFSNFLAAVNKGPALITPAPDATTSATGAGNAPGPGGAAPGTYATPSTAIDQGRAGVGVDWLAPFRSMAPSLFGGTQ